MKRLFVVVSFAVLTVDGYAQVTKAAIEALESQLWEQLPPARSELERDSEGRYGVERIDVTLPDGRVMPVLAHPPPEFEPTKRWPLLLAMHGGPMPDAASAFRGAIRMLDVWYAAAESAGYVVISPAMTHVVARGPRTEQTLPYEILTSEQMEAMLAEVAERYPIDPNRIVSTGISLGSNFSIGYAASRPDRFAAIVPVSTEGESREHLLRNLLHVPTFVLEGALDGNIRGIHGPRAMERIMKRFNYDIVYRELPDRAHEGFAGHYPEVLRWLAERPRNPYPNEILRVPHEGIMPIARRVHWIETDTRRAMLRAHVTTRARIDIDVRWARSVRIYLSDHFIELDEPFEIYVNGERVHQGKVERSLELATNDAHARRDPGRLYAASLVVQVPTSEASLERARVFSRSLAPRHPEGVLSFWETYAQRSLEDRMAPLGLTGHIVASDSKGELGTLEVDAVTEDSPFARAGIQKGDRLISVDDEPFFRDSTVGELRAWLVRELDARPRTLEIRALRWGAELTLEAVMSLEPF